MPQRLPNPLPSPSPPPPPMAGRGRNPYGKALVVGDTRCVPWEEGVNADTVSRVAVLAD